MNRRTGLRKKVNILAGIICCMLLFLMLPWKTEAAESKVGEITYLHKFEGVNVELYKVGTADQKDGFILEEAFLRYQVDLTHENAASLLRNYILRDKDELGFKPLQTQVTKKLDSSEEPGAVFTGLEPAVYLLFSEDLKSDNQLYVTQPSMLQLPQRVDEKLIYQVTIHTKDDFPPSEKQLSVLKVWKGDTAKKRPAKITVQLMKDGKLCKDREDGEVVLTAKNNWKYTWKDLDGEGSWTVVEKEVPSGYKVSQTKDGTTICLTNTYGGNTPPPPHNPPHIPQTGQDWSNILLMLASGLFLLLVGLIIFQKRKSEE